MTTYWCELAVVDGAVHDSIVVQVEGERITSVEIGAPRPDGSVALRGLTIPGMANAHSHAVHRALRSRTQRDGGSFWTWRDVMYRVADRLDPDSYFLLARATFAEMLMAGVTSIGEFHYVHHGHCTTLV